MIRFQALLLSILVIAACKHASGPKPPVELSPPTTLSPPKEDPKPNPSNPSPITAEVLPLEGMRWPNFAAYDATERCDALKEFSETFARTYGNSAMVTQWTCTKMLLIQELRIFSSFSLEQAGKKLGVLCNLELEETEAVLSLKVDSIESGDGYQKALGDMSPKLGHWGMTLRAFLKGSNVDRKIFGRPFQNFVEAVIVDMKNQGVAMKAKDGTLYTSKVTLIPSSIKATGAVRFDDVPDPLFASGGVLGCPSLACLNDGSVIYHIADELFSFSRQLPSTGSVKTINFTSARYTSFPMSQP